MADKAGVTKLVDRLPEVKKALDEMTRYSVEVGVLNDSQHSGSDLTNAQIGYLNETGAPECNIPARPHLQPGAKAAIPDMQHVLNDGFAAIFQSRNFDTSQLPRYFEEAARFAEDHIKGLIRQGLSPPLSARALNERAKRGLSDSTRPLFYTGEYMDSITHRVTYKGK